ncbi:diacylglycerol kinase [Streptomyces xinghaiensis]|nr:diacylglycerol kinase [Streptomyces xinghaiensis]
MSAPAPGERPLLIVIDPVARRDDAESVRIVRDVLCAGASAKVCLPDGPEDVARHLAHRGRRRPVVVGDDLALRRIVGLLHRERELADAALAFVPVGASARSTALARELGVPLGAVPAARVVLDGRERRLDLLVDDSDGVVIGGLSIPGRDGGFAVRTPWWQPALRGCRGLVRGHRRTNGSAGDGGRDGEGASHHRLRVEADGVVLVDLDRPVRDVSVTVCGGASGFRPGGTEPWEAGDAGRDGSRWDGTGGEGTGGEGARGRRAAGSGRNGHGTTGHGAPSGSASGTGRGGAARNGSGGPGAAGTEDGGGAGRTREPGAGPAAGGGPGATAHGPDSACGGLAHIVIQPVDGGRGGAPVTAHARAITVSGPDFHYRADAVVGGPVRTRTWTVRPGALRLTLPHPAPPSGGS